METEKVNPKAKKANKKQRKGSKMKGNEIDNLYEVKAWMPRLEVWK